MPAKQASRSKDSSVDPDEIAKFDRLARDWWDVAGPMRPLHRVNPVRLGYLRDRLCQRFGRDPTSRQPLKGLNLVDIGCGGGLVTEPMARLGASVTGLDMAAENIRVAKAHAAEAGLRIDYRHGTVEELAAEEHRFDAVLALEIVEHVADVPDFLTAVTALVSPGGALALSTINRTPKAFLQAIVGAEYLLRWLPRGTHDWRRFVRPAELARAMRAHGLAVTDVSGIGLDLRSGDWRLTDDPSVNYLMFALK